MNGRIVLTVLLVLGITAALVGFGYAIYNAGVQQGAASEANVVVQPQPAAPAYPHPYPYAYGPWFFPFGGFAVLVPLAIIFFIGFGLMRAMWWRGRWGGHWGHGWGGGWGMHGGKGDWDQQIPPRVAEWHRRMHEQSDQPHTS